MKLTYNWLKDFVQIKISAQQLADKLTMAGLEVVSLEQKDGDFVLEIEITSNRPDWLSVAGVAREVAAITGGKLKLPKLVNSPQTIVHRKRQKSINCGLWTVDCGQFSINIENRKDCPLYTAKIIREVKVVPPPDWLKKRLELIGCRSINNIVDITNYILFTYGEPLHAFDLDKLKGNEIIVRRAKEGERLTTIDGEQRKLNADILVIADAEKPTAIAGVMGGKYTEVTEGTKNILLEAAVFNPILIRRCRQSLGLQTDSSYRFERGIDTQTAGYAAWQAGQLIQELAGGKPAVARSSGVSAKASKTIILDCSDAQGILGEKISCVKIKQILSSLGFSLKAKVKRKCAVIVPVFRQDVRVKEDLLEEIARIYGFENIPASLPKFFPQQSSGDYRNLFAQLKNILLAQGLQEAITYSLVERNFPVTGEKREVEILNPLSQEQARLRTSLIPSLCQRVAYNLNQKQNCISLFEAASVFYWENNAAQEELNLGIVLCGVKSQFLSLGVIKQEAGLLSLKGILEVCLERLGIKDYQFAAGGENRTFNITAGRETLGVIQELSPEMLSQLEIKNHSVFALEVSLAKLFQRAGLKKKYLAPARFPGITRDISFILKQETPASEVVAAIRESGQPLLKEVKVADYYQGKQIPQGFRGLTVSCSYASAERTLTEEEVSPLYAKACGILIQRFAAKIR